MAMSRSALLVAGYAPAFGIRAPSAETSRCSARASRAADHAAVTTNARANALPTVYQNVAIIESHVTETARSAEATSSQMSPNNGKPIAAMSATPSEIESAKPLMKPTNRSRLRSTRRHSGSMRSMRTPGAALPMTAPDGRRSTVRYFRRLASSAARSATGTPSRTSVTSTW